MEFTHWLTLKKIDAMAFKDGQPTLFQEWEREFMQMHPNSFQAQKLFLVNNIRRKYKLVGEQAANVINSKPKVIAGPGQKEVPQTTQKPAISSGKPKFRPKVKPAIKPVAQQPSPATNQSESQEPKVKARPKFLKPQIKPKN